MVAPHNPLDLHDPLNYFLVRRVSYFLANTNHVMPASSLLSSFDTLSPNNLTLGNGQAMRVKAGQCNCFDNASTAKIVCQSMNLQVFTSPGIGLAFRGWQLNAVGYPLQSNGVVLNIPLDEFFYFDDIAEQGGGLAGRNILMALGVDANNTDATTAHTLTVNGTVTLELWQYTPNAMRGG